MPTGKVATVLSLTKHIVEHTPTDTSLKLPGVETLSHDLAQVIHSYQGASLDLSHVNYVEPGSLGIMLGVGSRVTRLSLKNLDSLSPLDLELLAQMQIYVREHANDHALSENDNMARQQSGRPVYALELSPALRYLVDQKADEIWGTKYGQHPVAKRIADADIIRRGPTPTPPAQPSVPVAPPETSEDTKKRRGFFGPLTGISAAALAATLAIRACVGGDMKGSDPDTAIVEPASTESSGSEPSSAPPTEPGIGSMVKTVSSEPATKESEVVKESPVLATLKARFIAHMERHAGVEWKDVERSILANPGYIVILENIEDAGGEPDVIYADKFLVFGDTIADVPSSRLGVSYMNATTAVGSLGAKLMSEKQYYALQRFGVYDTKSAIWLRSFPEVTAPTDIVMTARRNTTGAVTGRIAALSTIAGTDEANTGYRLAYSIPFVK